MSDDRSIFRRRASIRAARLHTRVNLMCAVVALLSQRLADRRYHAACAERKGIDITSRERLDRASRGCAIAKQAAETANEQDAPTLRERLRSWETDLYAAIASREIELGRVNDRIAQLELDREIAAIAVRDTMRACGSPRADLMELVALTGIEGAVELVSAGSLAEQHSRARTLLQALEAELRRADEDLGRVGQSAEYDAALSDLLDTEARMENARQRLASATAWHAESTRALNNAQRRLEAADRSIEMTDGVRSMGASSTPAAASAGTPGVPEAQQQSTGTANRWAAEPSIGSGDPAASRPSDSEPPPEPGFEDVERLAASAATAPTYAPTSSSTITSDQYHPTASTQATSDHAVTAPEVAHQ